ncbi:MAG: DUF3352 domain-containing protein [Solirubrobacterales bacterium]|nr:DUF3352 domain-containing protein [Solirubrobacterales bacterium]MCB8970645.1 DUF3352 domain-containing protein [Thermoleophilales bacterium]
MHSKLLRLALPVAILAIALFAAACGSDDEPESGPDPIAMVPADAPFYMEMVVRPEGELKDNLESAVGKLTGEDDPGAQIIDGLNSSLAEDTDLNYEDDIKPWLGSRAGVFVSGFQFDTEQPDAALVVATTDSDAAQGFVDSTLEESGDTTSDETYEGVSYKLDSEDGTAIGVDNDFLIVGTEQAFKAAVDAGSGDSLADNGDATAALDEAPDDSVFSMYADGAAITDLIKSSPDLSAQESKQLDEAFAQIPDGPVEAWGTVTDSSFSVEGSAPTPDDAPAATDLITTFPADSWFATASTDVGEQITTQLQQFQKGFEASLKQAKSQLPPGVDASQFDPFNQIEKKTGLNLEKDLGWIGDAGAFFEGTSVLGVGAGVVAESNDDKAATAALDKLQASLEKNRSLRRQAEIAPNSKGDGFTVSAPPFTAEFAVRDGKAVMAAGSENVDSVLDPDETLADSDRFSAATGNLADGATPTFFLDMPSLLALIESQQGATDDPDYAQAAPYLHAIDYMVAGTGTSGDRTVGSFVLGVKESDDAGSDAAAAMITP